MRPKVKYGVIHRHRSEYPISVMCKFFEVSRSGYYDIPSNSKSGTGHDPLGHEEREKESRCGELHSDQGFQYTSQAYFKLTQSYGIIPPSMSRKGNPYGNAMAENFFSILKTECIYRHKPKTFQEADGLIDKYIHFCNYERIQTKTGMAPLTLRHSA